MTRKSRLVRARIAIEKGARKYDAYLESLRIKGVKAKKEFQKMKRAIGIEYRKTGRVVGPPARSTANYLQRTSRAFASPIRYKPLRWY